MDEHNILDTNYLYLGTTIHGILIEIRHTHTRTYFTLLTINYRHQT